MSELLALLLPVLALIGWLVVRERRLVRQTLLAGFFGTLLAACAVVLRAPEVALAQVLVSSFLVPGMTLLALLRVGHLGDGDRRRGTRPERRPES